jgi:hypothetical protein
MLVSVKLGSDLETQLNARKTIIPEVEFPDPTPTLELAECHFLSPCLPPSNCYNSSRSLVKSSVLKKKIIRWQTVQICVTRTEVCTASNGNGRFELRGFSPADRLELIASFAGLGSAEHTVSICRNQPTTIILLLDDIASISECTYLGPWETMKYGVSGTIVSSRLPIARATNSPFRVMQVRTSSMANLRLAARPKTGRLGRLRLVFTMVLKPYVAFSSSSLNCSLSIALS